MKKYFLTLLLGSFILKDFALAKRQIHRLTDKPKISLLLAVALAQERIQDLANKKNWYCVGVKLVKDRTVSDWQFRFANKAGDYQYLSVGSDRKVILYPPNIIPSSLDNNKPRGGL